MIRTIGAPPQPHRRRRRAKGVAPEPPAEPLPLARATAIRAFAPFADEEAARLWLERATEAEETVDEIVAGAVALLNRALHAQWVAAAEAHSAELTPERAVAVRIGFGAGEEVADGRFGEAREVDVWATGSSRRRRREEGMRPQERVAAVLGGRERLEVCETLLLRARADLDAGRRREAALQLRVGLEALLAELGDPARDPAHTEDLETLRENRGEAKEAANAALTGELPEQRLAQVEELLGICERMLRRRRVLRG
ncbi:MAG: hypothetical protein JST31_14935 [Actinobacteria bacterium]|nr:hypothetical protein [Actinomycetota bacterium]